MHRAIATPTTVTAFCAAQVSNESRFRQRARRCKDHGMLGFVFPEFFKAHGFCPFHCHGFKIAWLLGSCQALDGWM
jgi:hypothetical protein